LEATQWALEIGGQMHVITEQWAEAWSVALSKQRYQAQKTDLGERPPLLIVLAEKVGSLEAEWTLQTR
jgi:hypothetical protein